MSSMQNVREAIEGQSSKSFLLNLLEERKIPYRKSQVIADYGVEHTLGFEGNEKKCPFLVFVLYFNSEPRIRSQILKIDLVRRRTTRNRECSRIRNLGSWRASDSGFPVMLDHMLGIWGIQVATRLSTPYAFLKTTRFLIFVVNTDPLSTYLPSFERDQKAKLQTTEISLQRPNCNFLNSNHPNPRHALQFPSKGPQTTRRSVQNSRCEWPPEIRIW